MNNFNLVDKRLKEKEFREIKHNKIEKLGFSLYKNDKVNVLLQQVHSKLELDNIQEYSNIIRYSFLREKKNIYASYLILCVEEKIDYEQFYMIERDNVALRKYIVRDEEDLKRIPFLDNITEDAVTETNVSQNKENSLELEMVFAILEEHNSKSVKLNEKQVIGITDTLMNRLELHYEH